MGNLFINFTSSLRRNRDECGVRHAPASLLDVILVKSKTSDTSAPDAAFGLPSYGFGETRVATVALLTFMVLSGLYSGGVRTTGAVNSRGSLTPN
jgi:hypothetical protein